MALPAVDARYADPELAGCLGDYFARKSAGDIVGFTRLFHRDAVYADATLGWCVRGRETISSRFGELMPRWVETGEVSYPTRVLGDATGGVAFVTASPQLLGSEIRAVSAVDIVDGQVVRFIDYWDGRHFGRSRTQDIRVPAEQFPASFGEELPAGRADGLLDDVVERLSSALARGDAAGAARLCATDVTFEDLTLRVRVHGSAAMAVLLERSVAHLPYGGGVQIRHVAGGRRGGGFEWINPARPVTRGITAVALDQDGLVTEFCSIWDGTLVPDEVLLDWNVAALTTASRR